MNRAIFCVMAAGALASPISVFAQSSVTLYGLVDVGVQYANNVQTAVTARGPVGSGQVAMTDGHSTGVGSRWGLRGSEDLGGGMKAIFVIENGFMGNTGALAQGGAEFGRQSWVGLSMPAGTLTLGRQYDPMTETLQPLAAVGQFGGYMAAHVADVDNLGNANRVNNAIKYTSPTWGGLEFGALYSFGGVAGDFSRNQVWATSARWSTGPFVAAMGYLRANDPNVSFYGNTPNKGTATANNIGSFGSSTSGEALPVDAGYASAKTLQNMGLGFTYSFDPATVGIVVTNTRFGSLGSGDGPNPRGYSGNVAFTNVEVNASLRVNPAFLIGAAVDYTQRSAKGNGNAKYAQLNLAAIYSLSKRTSVYALAAFQQASGVDSLGQSAVAAISGFGPSSTSRQLGARIGIRHRF